MIEADETYFGKVKADKNQHELVNDKGWVKGSTGGGDKYKVVTLIEREGRARSTMVDFVNAKSVSDVLRANTDPAPLLMTDTSNVDTGVC